MLFRSLIVSIAGLIFFGTNIFGEEFRVPLTSKAPIIDGKIDPAEWQTSVGFEGFQDGGNLVRRRIRVNVAADEQNIYVAIQSQLPDTGVLLTNTQIDNISKAVFDEAIELYINPTPDSTDKVDYQYLVNSIGKGGYNLHKLGNPKEEVAWNGNWKIGNGFHNGFWHFECMVPIASMKMVEPGRKTTDGVWSINIARDWKDHWQWSSLSGGYAHAGYRFTFVKDPAPVAAYTSRSDAFLMPYEGTFTIKNPSNKPLELKALMLLEKNNMPEIKDERTIKLLPGATQELRLAVDKGDPTKFFTLKLKLTSADTTVTYYSRSVKWSRATDPYRWIAGIKAKQLPVDFKFAYYPSQNKMRIDADISGLPAKAKATGVVAKIRTQLEKTLVKSVVFPIANFKSGHLEQTFELLPLQGQYEIAVSATGKDVPKNEVIKTFERTVFPWENTPVGYSEKVYPPFTPIKIAGKKLSTVLRDYTLSDIGLLDQISAQSANTGIIKPVLASPMRYTVTVDSQSLPIKSGQLTVESAKDNEAIVTGEIKAGPFSAKYKNTWDYDGTVKVELTLLPTGNHIVNELTLEIPFTNESGAMIHSNSDRIRNPVAQKVPEGSGVVWDASKVVCDEYIKNFCPYVYIGTAVRGLCWFAENDKNWGWNRTTSNLDVVRKGGNVILRVHLINQPTKITTAQTITFGMLAAPIKPLLVAPDKNTNWSRYRYNRDNYSLLGTDINWLALGDCGSVYPAGQDMYLWEMLARGNKERLPESEIEKVINHAKTILSPYSKDEMYGMNFIDFFNNTVKHNLLSRFGTKMIFYYNRGSCQLFPEFETFKDEWCLDDYRTVGKGNSRGEIRAVPSQSYIDYNLYWYARSFETGANRAVYWDNWFISPSYNTEMTDAYNLPDGKIVPSAGIWELRELSKRTFIMLNERGMLPITYPHMTSFAPLPMLSFATAQLDWEWKYSEGDVQERFTPEYLQLASSGELAGAWPVVLADQGPKNTDPWIQRTFTGVKLLYELSYHAGPVINESMSDPVIGMLDKEGLIVYKYWEDRPQPIKTNNPDFPAIVYSVPGKEAVAVIVSYSREDLNVSLDLDLATLGFTKSVIAQNAEDGSSMKIENGKIVFPLKKHDVRIIRLTQGK